VAHAAFVLAPDPTGRLRSRRGFYEERGAIYEMFGGFGGSASPPQSEAKRERNPSRERKRAVGSDATIISDLKRFVLIGFRTTHQTRWCRGRLFCC
jgi:hypothetical protein